MGGFIHPGPEVFEANGLLDILQEVSSCLIREYGYVRFRL
jgi:hypothetical protein